MAGTTVKSNGSDFTDGEGIPVTIDDAGSVIPTDDGPQDSGGIPTVEPAAYVIEPESTGTGQRRRGRQPGSKNRPKPATATQTKELEGDLGNLLFSCHAMLAAITATPELCLEKEESERLGKAVARVNREYGGMVLDPKTAAWVNLIFVGGSIYGPRAIAIRNNRKKKKEPKPVTDKIQ